MTDELIEVLETAGFILDEQRGNIVYYRREKEIRVSDSYDLHIGNLVGFVDEI